MVNLVEAQKPLLHYVIRRAGLRQHTVDVDGAGTVISFWLPKNKVPKDKATVREITPEAAGTNKQAAKKQHKITKATMDGRIGGAKARASARPGGPLAPPLPVATAQSSFHLLGYHLPTTEPNAENGLDLEKYSWTQQLPDVSVIVPVPQGTKSKFVICEIKKNHLKVGLKGQSPTIDGELYQPVKVVECFWSIDDGESLSILLTKQNQMVWWKSVIKGDPEMDIRKVKPITKLSDLDPETRETIKKAIIDHRRKELGLPTSDEIQKQELLKNLMTQMDFSRENMA